MNFHRRSLIDRDAASRHSGVDRVAGAADRGRSDVGRPLSALAARARPGVRRLGAAGAADLVGLPAVLRHRSDRVWTDLRSCRPQAGAARRAVVLRRDLLELHVRDLDRNADRLALPAGPGRRRRAGAGARHRPRSLSRGAGRPRARPHGLDHGARAGRGAFARRHPAVDIRLARELPRHGRAWPLRDPAGDTAIARNHEAAAAGADVAPSIVRGYGIFLRHRTFRIYLAIVAASYGGLFAWISGSSFVLQDLYGLSPLLFGLVFAAATLGYGLGTLLAARLVVPHRHRSHHRMRRNCPRRRRAGDGGRHCDRRDLARCPGAADGALSLRSRSGHAAIDGGRAHAVSRTRGRRLIAAWLLAAGDRVRDRHHGGADARRERAARLPRSSPPWAFSRLRSRFSDARWVPFINPRSRGAAPARRAPP